LRYWNESSLATVEIAVARARQGQPTLLILEGDPGMGKSTLVEELLARASDFAVCLGQGVDGDSAPYALLGQWGAQVPRTAQGRQIQPFVAAQTIRALTDSIVQSEPVILLADDVQWVDQESLEALSWLMRRTAGDRLLAVVAHRLLTGRHTRSGSDGSKPPMSCSRFVYPASARPTLRHLSPNAIQTFRPR
jgi:hypothetical protein